MKKERFLTSGEFAALCKTTKATLFHYDQEGLLKPRHVSTNGYRRYGVEQFFDFDMISLLKETGSSLEEIREHQQNLNGESLLRLLEKKKNSLKQEYLKLRRREIMLHDMISGIREALNCCFDVLSIEDKEIELLECVPTGTDKYSTIEDYITDFTEYIDFYANENRILRRPFGSILDENTISGGEYVERFYFSKASKKTPDDLLHRKIAGKYAIFAHKGTHESHLQSLHDMYHEILEHGFDIKSNCYCYDMASYAIIGSGEQYAAKYHILVK